MSRTTRFQILVVLRLPTFDSNFATLLDTDKKNPMSIFQGAYQFLNIDSRPFLRRV